MVASTALLVAVMMLASCTSEDTFDTGTTTTTDPIADEVEARGEPEVEVPDRPASKLEIEDLIEGTGDAVRPSSTVTLQYVGVAQSTGTTFDSSWSKPEPATFSLDEVIPGWSEGVVGMRVGGRRRLVIPADLGYRDQPPDGSGIEPGDTLVFVVDLIRIDEQGPDLDRDAVEAAEARGRPEASVPDPLPKKLTTTDEVRGDGPTVDLSDRLSMQYVVVAASTGAEIDSTWGQGTPAAIVGDQLLPGWARGLQGMRVGGRRMIVIPPKLAFGAKPPEGSNIRKNETLVITVDLVGVG